MIRSFSKNRICKECGLEKPIKEYYLNNDNKNYTLTCKSCLALSALKSHRKESIEKLSPCFIYIIKNPAWVGYLKIGRASNIDNRLKSYQTSSPHRDYEVVYSKKIKNPYLIEKHFELNYVKTKNEWIFEKTDVTIKIINDLISKHDLLYNQT